ncbi:MAG: NAD(P)H-hydrate epimerase, partial [Actinomycetota bacterium]|nr:NAD(P)H-hydrate epimerase [Actinomycetota bacterium]
GIELVQMMENAGRNLAHLARTRFLGGDPRGKRVVVMAGTGGNGGGALVCAHQLRILRRMRVEVGAPPVPGGELVADLIVDGIIGYSLKGSPRGAAGELIRRANAQCAPILSLDVPSGVDATSGIACDPAVEATATMTLALPKEGLRAPGARAHVGELYLADIGVPPSLYAGPALGLRVGSIFAESDVVRLS